ncbi:uncharacterized protein LOC135929759 [Gordionus sp. m RMFG-2023]|uniref:uncharacterized protein LOC135929759 n=1 Tax=Gordionus sp. m RMFG-2023 TaxID=3053472 RepID=UPI0031FBAF03
MKYSIWCLLLAINYVQGCVIKTIYNDEVEERRITDKRVQILYEHLDGTKDKDGIMFENCNGTLQIYYEQCQGEDGFHFIKLRITPFHLPEDEKNLDISQMINQTDTDLNDNTVNKRYEIDNKGSIFALKGLRIGNQKRYIRLIWFDNEYLN